MKALKIIFCIIGAMLTLALVIIGWKVYLETGSGFEGVTDALYHCGLVGSIFLTFAPLWLFE